jgi:hypothetical protein
MHILEIIGSVDPRDGGAVEGSLRQSSVRASRGLETHIASLDPPQAPWVLDCPVKTFGPGSGIEISRGRRARAFWRDSKSALRSTCFARPLRNSKNPRRLLVEGPRAAGERRNEHRPNRDTDEVSDLQSEGERERGLYRRTCRHVADEVGRGNGSDAGRNGRNQAKNLIAGTEHRAAQNTENGYHELNSCHFSIHGKC